MADPLPATPVTRTPDSDLTSPKGAPRHALLQHADSVAESEGSSTRDPTPEPPSTTLPTGPFAGLAFPHASARANAVHVVREYVSTYLITHPHLDHLSGFVINTAAFHNTSRPKRLAALPFTVNAIKTHLFNDVIWPNLTDEDGGVGFVTFQRLAEGGNIALGVGRGSGYIEVCDGLEVRGFRVSHGHCMKGLDHVHRGSSSAAPPPTPGLGGPAGFAAETPRRASSALFDAGGPPNGHARSLSISAVSQPGTPGLGGQGGVTHCIVDSTAFFVRAEATGREILVFGDVEPDALSLSPRNAAVWAEAAPKVAAGILAGVFIECSYSDAQGDAVLFGHLAPRHLVGELGVLAEMVEREREAREREGRERSARRKRKRGGEVKSVDWSVPAAGAPEERRRRSEGWGLGRDAHQPAPLAPPANAESARDAAAGNGGAQQKSEDAPAAAAADEVKPPPPPPPLAGLKVVVIHVKDTLTDGPLVGEMILAQLREHERRLADEAGQPLGCTFEVSAHGASYWF